ncbi:hypothetical protein HHE02_17350 [Helicobacter heilmannii]|nr:hypothetical protein [Helicobacter heilmannii]CRF48410.1 hypothetical protein HHE02_17350 [Helicobacter heilmannii]
MDKIAKAGIFGALGALLYCAYKAYKRSQGVVKDPKVGVYFAVIY